ncbi:uncharacterized protein LOC116351163 isoform X2 [Contarinia nasturtii]|uniref:uncharacterized protein LOC116351163 isoform X2 n=1 Tax=Contarinia nasturtii TaxID=265458 RepID=UPI0012D3AC9D|nr:uncharacterized protein LOC116351163 isoform X2 [Contarinia nasturtii]
MLILHTLVISFQRLKKPTENGDRRRFERPNVSNRNRLAYINYKCGSVLYGGCVYSSGINLWTNHDSCLHRFRLLFADQRQLDFWSYYKPVFMLIALAGWLFPAASCLYCVFIGIVRGIQHLKVENLEEDKFPLFKIVCFALVFIGIYIIAVFCYCSVKRAAIRRKPNTMRLNIKYEVPQGNVEQNEGIRLYPTLNTDQI